VDTGHTGRGGNALVVMLGRSGCSFISWWSVQQNYT
jgi:hypothetical protein